MFRPTPLSLPLPDPRGFIDVIQLDNKEEVEEAKENSPQGQGQQGGQVTPKARCPRLQAPGAPRKLHVQADEEGEANTAQVLF